MTVIHTQVEMICNLLNVNVICGCSLRQVICYHQVQLTGVSIMMRYSEYSLCGML